MTWFKVDDTLSAHPKTRAAGLAAMGLWVVAGSWSSQQLTEGFIPTWFVETWPRGRRHAVELVAAGLWIQRSDGWEFHDWTDCNPTAEKERARRKSAADRQRRARERAAERREAERDAEESARTESEPSRVTSRVSHGSSHAPPVPARLSTSPLPPADAGGGKPKKPRRSPSTPLPDGFAITDVMRAWHRAQGIADRDADWQTQKFCGWALANDRRFADWTQAWRNWLTKAIELGHIRPATNGRRSWSADELNAVLGPDLWTCPRPPNDLDGDAKHDWIQRVRAEHRAQRIAEAEARTIHASATLTGTP